MAENSDGGPAFPAGAVSAYKGMSLRDYFAAKAMQAYMGWALDQPTTDEADTRQKAAAHYARVGYAIADAMLKARGR